jgi:propanediol dehydratase small subunit
MLQVYGQDVSEEEFILRMWNALGKYKTSEEDIKKVNEGTLKIYGCRSLKMYIKFMNRIKESIIQI